MIDLSATHTRCGALWIPKGEPQPAAPAATPEPDLEALDIPRYRAFLTRQLEAAAARADNAALTADERQYAVGVKHGLAAALRLLMGTRVAPAAVAAPAPFSNATDNSDS